MKHISYLFLIIIILFVFIPSGEISLNFPPKNISNDNFLFQRYYPFKNIPRDGFYKAWLQKKAQLKKSKFGKLLSNDQWESIGPVNQGGRTIAVAFDPENPNIVFAGSASGGLWKLTFTDYEHSQYHWERINTGYPVLGVNSIAIDPRNSDIMYIGTGEYYFYKYPDGSFASIRVRGNYGIGLLKTTDGGKSWAKSLDWTYDQQTGVLDVEINPDDPDIVFAATSEGTFRSKDAGATWELVHKVIMGIDIEINPDNPDIVFLSCGNLGTEGTGIYRSTDGGDNWQKLTNGLPENWTGKTLLDIYGKSSNVIYADIAEYAEYTGLYRSTDNGENWEKLNDVQMASYIGQGYYSHFSRVNPEDSSEVVRAKIHHGYSSDGGRNFTIPFGTYDYYTNEAMPHPDHHAFANHPDDPNTFIVANDGGLYITKDNGRNFKPLNDGYVTAQFYQGFSSSKTDPDFALGGLQDNSTAIYIGSPVWATKKLGGDGAFTAIDPSDRNLIYGSSQYLNVYRSETKGENWDIPDDSSLDWEDYWGFIPIYQNNRHQDERRAFVAPFVIAKPGTLYAATNYIYKSTDRGTSWNVLNNDIPLSSGAVVALDVSKTNLNYIYAAAAPNWNTGERSKVFFSSDGGNTWIDVTRNLPDRYFVDLIVSPFNPNECYITLSGFRSSHIYRTTNRGTSWSPTGKGLPDCPTNAIAIDPQNFRYIYAGNDLGAWVSTNDGVNWEPFTQGMPNAAMVMDLSISDSTRLIRAVTHGNGVYQRELLPVEPNYIPEDTGNLSVTYNPFINGTTIIFELETHEYVKIDIYDYKGRIVKNFKRSFFRRGKNGIFWDGLDNSGKQVTSGAYYINAKIGSKDYHLAVIKDR